MLTRPPIARQLPKLHHLRPTTTTRTFIFGSKTPSRKASLDTLNLERMSKQSQSYHRNRQNFLLAGAVTGVISCVYTAYLAKQEWSGKENKNNRAYKLDSALPPSDPVGDVNRKIIIHDDEGHDLVPTGYPIVPNFPRILNLPNFATADSSTNTPDTTDDNAPNATAPTTVVPKESQADVEYTLVGLGMRTVTFFNINVYLVGFYIATADIAELQSKLVKKINPIASTLVADEKDKLRTALLDPRQGEELWEELLRAGIPARSAFRVVPVRDTDFPHLRDGFVRAIQGKADKSANDDPNFGEAVKDFRGLFTRGKLHAQKELLMARDVNGVMSVIINQSKRRNFEDRMLVGRIKDERISRALWLNYLAGNKVASEPARRNVVEGVMEFVERPVGTVATQVV